MSLFIVVGVALLAVFQVCRANISHVASFISFV
jgi:hypothetical protein